MKKKNLIIIVLVLVIVIGAIIGISKAIENARKEYDSPLVVDYNYYKVYTNEKYGILNVNGELVVPAKYDDIIIPNPSKAVFICLYDYNNSTEEYKYDILNDNGEKIFEQYDDVEAIAVTGIISNMPYEKWALRYKKDGKFGLVGIDGSKITNADYEELVSVPYKEGVFLVKKDGKYGVINNKGAFLIKNEYDGIIGDGLGDKKSCFIVTKGEYVGFFSDKGDKIIDTEYDSIQRIKEIPDQYLIIAKKNGQYGLLNNTKIIIGFNYQEIKYDSFSNLIIAKRNKNYGVINIEGNRVIPIEYNEVSIEGEYILAIKDGSIEKYQLNGEPIGEENNFIRVEKTNDNYYFAIDNNYNYILLDKDKKAITKNQYEYLEYLFDDLFVARDTNGKYGVINLKEEVLVDFQYDVMHVVKNSKIVQAVIIEEGNLSNLYNKDMKMIYEANNVNIYSYDNYVMVSTFKEMAYFDKNGERIENSVVFPNNSILAYKENEKWGFKDRNGNVVVEAIYDKVTDLNKNGFAGIYLNNRWGVIDADGNIIVETKYEINDTFEPEFLGKYYHVNETLYLEVKTEE